MGSAHEMATLLEVIHVLLRLRPCLVSWLAVSKSPYLWVTLGIGVTEASNILKGKLET